MSHKFYPYPTDYKNTTSLRRARRAGNVFVIILCILIALLLGGGTFFALTNNGQGWDRFTDFVARGLYLDQKTQSTSPAAELQPAAKTPTAKPATDPDVEPYLAQPFDPAALTSIPDVVDAVSPGVVGILNYQNKTGKTGPVLAGSGSGFVYTENGYVITNQHVVEGAAALKVSMPNGETVDALLVGSDIQTDVAVLKIEADGLKALPIGDSASARVGEFVLAIGDPISADELSGSVTFGIVSALSREINIEGFVNEYLQTDAAVNPGNSGGPLINMRGEVIGVTSAKYTSAGVDEYGQNISSEGIGFALPINNVMEIVQSIIKEGSKVRPGIGVTIVTYLEPTATVKTPGVYIYGVTEGGPADDAGIQVGDRLVKLNGKELTQDEFVAVIRMKEVGESIVLTIERNGETQDITVVVGDMNQMHK
ncbi:MAG: trypsin-like peptidase domain-containing protein [Clostridia bacterium]|nr:trypsin-like peptidase domain-containing protein [Clostridia bacterium]